MTPLLITGASGFLGRNLIEELSAGDVRGIHAVARMPPSDVPGAQWHSLDLLEHESARRVIAAIRPRTIIHLAWCATPGVFWSSPENTQWLERTRELGEAAADLGVRRLVVAGTCAEYDWSGDGTLQENVTPFRPATPYGQAKHAARLAIEEIARQSGMSLAWLRVFWTCGRHEHPARLVPGVIRGLRSGEVVPLTEGTQAIDMVAASDLARAFIAAARSGATGAFDLASGRPVTVRTIAERIAARIGGSDRLKFGMRPTPPGTPDLIVGQAGRLCEAAGWRPVLDLDQMLEAAVDWWSDPSRIVPRA